MEQKLNQDKNSVIMAQKQIRRLVWQSAKSIPL